jgi:branched-chain amino acid transport system permease protein
MLIFGLAMILVMLFRPGGIWPRKRGEIERSGDLLSGLVRKKGAVE